MLVVLFHLWPTRLTGGYVGVDVFFVISGFLITSHLHRELRATGTILLREFWARRIRRLLPASLLVLAGSAIAVAVFLPATQWGQAARQIGASALYVQNWALAADQVDYLAADNAPTVAQHYWSLSIEEQFYLVWPLLLIGLAFLWRRLGRKRSPLGAYLIGGLGVLAGASLAASIVSTTANQGSAYFLTQARAWEFAAGALVALCLPTGEASGRLRRVQAPLLWCGLAAIVFSGITFDGGTPFPGWVALLPVFGTVAVIVGGVGSPRILPVRLLGIRPMTFVGDLSYSIYLWHWAVLIVWPYATGGSVGTWDKIVIFAATVVLAWLTKVFVEDPGRRARWLVASPWRTMLAAAAGMLLVVAGAAAITSELHRREAAAEASRAEAMAAGCFGPDALNPGSGCEPVEGRGPLYPPPEVVVLQAAHPPYPNCLGRIPGTEVSSCILGSASATPDRIVAVVGDSHAGQWMTAFDAIGVERNWRIITYVKASCPFSAAERTLVNERFPGARSDCHAWVEEVTERLLASDEISYVFTASRTPAYGFESPEGVAFEDPTLDGFVAKWSELTEAGMTVFVIADIPMTGGVTVADCLADHADDRSACAMHRRDALPGGGVSAAVAKSEDPDVHLIDLTPWMCDETTCFAVVGDVIVFHDSVHLSEDFSRALAPYILAVIDAAADSRSSLPSQQPLQ